MKMVICNQYPYQNRKYILIDGKKRLLKRNSEKFYSIDISETQTISKKEMTEIPLGGDIVKYSKKYKHCKSMEQARVATRYVMNMHAIIHVLELYIKRMEEYALLEMLG